MGNYAIGVDFGTLSARAVLIDLNKRVQAAGSVMEYPHGVMSERLTGCGTALPPDFALQHPADYLSALETTVKGVVADAGIDPAEVIGIGIDFTSCTVLPLDEDCVPLCFRDKYKDNPHAYAKLWKHHAAQPQANRISAAYAKTTDSLLSFYGGKVSSEWFHPRAMELFDHAPGIYSEMAHFAEAGDWIVRMLCGELKRSACMAGFKALRRKDTGYPDDKFLSSACGAPENLARDKMRGEVIPAGSLAGFVTPQAAARFGLAPGTAVSAAVIDAHAALPAAGVINPGAMLLIIGTSACHILLGEYEKPVPGICGVVHDGIIEGYYAYEAGQTCSGDHFDWAIRNCVNEEYINEARERGINMHVLLREKARLQRPGENGLIAVDWYNGCRTPLVDADLSGLIIGMTLATKSEDIYRALIEATAYGTRTIIEAFEKNGVPVERLVAAGGIAVKDPFMMQIYADVLGREISVTSAVQAGAFGSAMFAAVAAGASRGGYATMQEACAALCRADRAVYYPNVENTTIYDELYTEYTLLCDYFGRGANDVMKRLKARSLKPRGLK